MQFNFKFKLPCNSNTAIIFSCHITIHWMSCYYIILTEIKDVTDINMNIYKVLK